jgi:hypothetical protein
MSILQPLAIAIVSGIILLALFLKFWEWFTGRNKKPKERWYN